jgi:hypothetical protein
MSTMQIIVFAAALFWLFFSLRGAGAIIASTFMPSSVEILAAFAISFLVNGLAVGGIVGLAYAVTRLV